MVEIMKKNALIRQTLPWLILAVLVIAHWSSIQKLNIRWGHDDNSYCYLIVPFFLYLCWDKRNTFKFSEFTWSLWGFPVIIGSTILMLLGEIGSLETFVYLGLWAAVAGILITLYGKRVRHLAFALFILLFIVPLPPFINRVLTFQLKLLASTLAVETLRMTGASVLQTGNIIDIGTTKLQVVDACSGLRYVMPMIITALFINYLFVKGSWRKLVLLVLVPPLSVLINTFRIVVTGKLHLMGYPELAENFFHDFSGWLVFMVAGAVLVGIAVLLNRTGKIPDETKAPPAPTALKKHRNGIPTAITAFICLLFIGSGWAMQNVAKLAYKPERQSFQTFPMSVNEWRGKKSYLDESIMQELWADDYINAVFVKPETTERIFLFIPFYEYQGTRHTAHAPQSCLLGSGWSMLLNENRNISVQPGKSIAVRIMHLEKDNARMLGSYFFFQRGRVVTNPWLNKAYLVKDSIMRRRTDGALVRVELLLGKGQSMESGYRMLEDFIRAIWPILPEYIPT